MVSYRGEAEAGECSVVTGQSVYMIGEERDNTDDDEVTSDLASIRR